MRFTTIFFDLDDTLYPSNTGLWLAIKERMNIYMRERMGFPEDQIAHIREKYFLQYGTTLRGLQAHHEIDVQDFLAFVHDLPLKAYLTPNPVLRSIIASLPTRNLIFTNADSAHADRVLTALGLRDLFDIVVDVNAIAPYCKPMPESFQLAMQAAGESDPSKCVMIDDIHRTTSAASQAGLFSILYNERFPAGSADAHLTDWSQLVPILEGQHGK
ncbi:MAG TPA: pyrimidine 5'-nucleotidase [Anaerolineales bacterium]|nr:pyrimidine 5'-nucleotidase [Anaerolineales bacterium]